MNPSAKILLVEDNPTLGYALSEYLDMQGFKVSLMDDGLKGEQAFKKDEFDLCIIDVMLPGQDGFSLVGKIKEISPDQPVIFLTAKGMKIDKLKGFKLGADDYLVKPIDEEELVARIQAILKRTQPGPIAKDNAIDHLGEYTIYWALKKLVIKQKEIHLSEKEIQLLKLLFEHQNRLLPREMALSKLWGKNDYFNRRSMDVHVAKLRKYLKADPAIQIANVHGRGFILQY
ncbi:response regulator transcription factor [Flexithrix dorotheae]|uniref:response regulator transcription factor n=1 Tax=Flexithrix dorotheae TaxID=70993 RepID=UPI00037884EE|nr:response regulator transcription factor [Flexithrix dorotheae]